MMRKLMMLLASLTLIPLCGCELPPSNVDEHMGSATRNATKIMVADRVDAFGQPAAESTISGPDAALVLENYRENQTAESQKTRREDAGLVDLKK
jgi:hypothetical protein